MLDIAQQEAARKKMLHMCMSQIAIAEAADLPLKNALDACEAVIRRIPAHYAFAAKMRRQAAEFVMPELK